MVIDIKERIAKCFYKAASPIHMESEVYGERDISIKNKILMDFSHYIKWKSLTLPLKQRNVMLIQQSQQVIIVKILIYFLWFYYFWYDMIWNLIIGFKFNYYLIIKKTFIKQS